MLDNFPAAVKTHINYKVYKYINIITITMIRSLMFKPCGPKLFPFPFSSFTEQYYLHFNLSQILVSVWHLSLSLSLSLSFSIPESNQTIILVIETLSKIIIDFAFNVSHLTFNTFQKINYPSIITNYT